MENNEVVTKDLTEEKKVKEKVETIKECFQRFKKTVRTTYPILYKHIPLAIGIHQEIQHLDGFDDEYVKYKIRIILGRIVNDKQYLKNLMNGTVRYHLDGSEAGEVTEENKLRAKEVLENPKERSMQKNKSASNILPIPPIPSITSEEIEKMPECKTEISIKLNEIPTIIDLGKQVLLRTKQGGIVIESKLNAKSWRKAVRSAESFGQFVINIKGQLGKMTKYGITLEQAGISVFEKKVKTEEV